jgi:hypothetical protein
MSCGTNYVAESIVRKRETVQYILGGIIIPAGYEALDSYAHPCDRMGFFVALPTSSCGRSWFQLAASASVGFSCTQGRTSTEFFTQLTSAIAGTDV